MSLNNMRNRLGYYGGNRQLDRMNADKLRSLKKALLYSYQAATAILSDGREFRCLINPNKLSLDLDNKIISIPFRDYCLNQGYDPDPDTPSDPDVDVDHEWEDMEDLVAVLSYSAVSEGNWEDMGSEDEPDVPDDPVIPPIINNGEVEIGLKEGDTITWKENGSHWLVYLRRLEETAYFRADLRRCRYQLTLGNGSQYWAYVRGPVEQLILWSQTSGNYFNKLNYSLVMYISQNEETLKYFKRFKKIMINNQPWEVQSVDSVSTPGILEISLKETYNNTIETDIEKVVQETVKEEKIEEKVSTKPYVYGAATIYPYDTKTYSLKNYSGARGQWQIVSMSRKNIAKIVELEDYQVEVQIKTGKSGSFTLAYIVNDKAVAALDITIESL